MNASRKYFSLFMAGLMLMMSIGITMHKMVCLVSGVVTFSFFQNDECCGNEDASAKAVKTTCCDYSTDYFKMDIQTLVTAFDFRFDLIADLFTIPDFFFPEIISAQHFEYAHAPPLISGKDILILVSVFRI